jgi:adenine-specific DNA-methyltransferase
MKLDTKEILSIKKKLDMLVDKLDDRFKDLEENECILFRYICEYVLIKSCVDNDLIDIEMIDNDDIEKVKANISNINTEFKKVFKLGEKYSYNFSIDIHKEIKKIFYEYEYINIDFDFLGKLYQLYLSKEERKKFGQFYTPESIIDEILDNVEISNLNRELFNCRILDPSCGSGGFIVRIISRIINIGIERNLDVNDVTKFIFNNIYGFDIKEFSIYLSKINILIQVIPLLKYNTNLKIKYNLYATNSLKNLGDNFDFSLEESKDIVNIKNKKGKLKNGFDFIVGNPPYFKAKNLTEEQHLYFSEINTGQQNVYSMFLYMGIKLLKKGGRLGFIIPESIRSGKYFEGIRGYIFDNCTITHLTTFNCRKSNFHDALQGILLICLTNEVLNDDGKKINIKSVNNENYLLVNRYNGIEVKYHEVVRNINNYRLLVICNKHEDYEIINKAYSNCTFLSNPKVGFKVSTGKLVWNQKKQFLTDTVNTNNKKIIWSNNICRYYYDTRSEMKNKFNYVKYNDELSSLSSSGKVILIKRTSTKEQESRIIGCLYDNDDRYFIENHVNYIVKSKEAQFSYEYLLVLLNSNLLNFIASKIMGNTQLSVTEINLLPIKYKNNLKLNNFIKFMFTQKDKYEVSFLKEEIDSIINEIYEINI